jgi:hypothetical protein
VVDGGDLLWKMSRIPKQKVDEIDVKADLIAQAYGLVGLDAMTLGEGELALGVDKLKSLAASNKLPILAANLDCGGSKPFPGHVVVDRGGWRLGFFGLVPDQVTVEGCTVSDLLATAATETDALGKVDVVVALGPFNADTGRQLVEKVPAVNFVISGGDVAINGVQPLGSGHWILGTGAQGKKLGVLTGTATPGSKGWRDQNARSEAGARLDAVKKRLEGAKERLDKAGEDQTTRERAQKQIDALEQQIPPLQKEVEAAQASDERLTSTFKNRMIDLGTDIADHEGTLKLVTAAKARLETLGASSTREPPVTAPAVPMPQGETFAGVMSCRSCHEPEFDQWKGTLHARAYASLVHKKAEREEGCYTCHVTGAGEPGGPTSPDSIGLFLNVGCEACHGAGRPHAENPAENAMSANVSPDVCLKCHGREGDPGHYDQATYWPQVLHKSE